MSHNTALRQLDELQAQLHALRAQQTSNHAFSAGARGHAALLAALPPRYAEVLLALLDRLEAGALFTEESCSFSHGALVDALTQWAAKAEAALRTAAMRPA